MDYRVGDVVYCEFPHTNMESHGDRTVLIVADIFGDDAVVCMITKKKPRFDSFVEVSKSQLKEGALSYDPSFIRPVRLATVSKRIIRRKACSLGDGVMVDVLKTLRDKFTR